MTTLAAVTDYVDLITATYMNGVLNKIQNGTDTDIKIASIYAAAGYPCSLTSGAASTGSLYLNANNAGQYNAYMQQDGTGNNLVLIQSGVLAANKFNLWLQSNTAQTTSSLFYSYMNNAGSTSTAHQFLNAGTGSNVYVNQVGALAAGCFGIYLYSNAIQVNSPLLYTHQDNSSSTAASVYFQNDGVGWGVFADQVGVLTAGNDALHVESNAIQTGANSVLLGVDMLNASSTDRCVAVSQAGTGGGIHLTHVGVLAASMYGVYIYSNTAQVNSPLFYAFNDNAGTTTYTATIKSDGSANGLAVMQVYNDAANCAHINFGSNTASAPSAPVEGDFWYDKTNHLFKYYNGTAVKTIATV